MNAIAPNSLKPSERVKIPRQAAPERPGADRVRGFDEVCLGFDPARARQEALRCLDCPKPACVRACPVEIDIPGFIRRLLAGDEAGAAQRIREANSLPAVCGRVCPQESQCEAACALAKRFGPVAIGQLERYVADREPQRRATSETPNRRPQARVAIVGSGPAGLTCASELARFGYRVTVFEALHAVGGVLRYGIPEFRLPKAILDEEARRIEVQGVEFRTNFVVGRTATLDELRDDWGFGAIFVATGAGTPGFFGILGEGLNGVYSANEFLTRVNLMGAWRFPEYDTPVKVGRATAVIGGGNTALDAIRTARRLGADAAYLIYRRSRQEMPARAEEVRHAEGEGVELRLLTSPLRILGEAGWVAGIECQRMELGPSDASGRPRPMPVPGSEHVIRVETVIEAIGQSPNPIIQRTTPGLAVDQAGTLVVDARQATNRAGVFAGGDVARGGATVILAMRDGRRAARAIHGYLAASGTK